MEKTKLLLENFFKLWKNWDLSILKVKKRYYVFNIKCPIYTIKYMIAYIIWYMIYDSRGSPSEKYCFLESSHYSFNDPF